MTKRFKFESKQAATDIMAHLCNEGHVGCWDFVGKNTVRYFDPVARVWRDLIEYDLKRWGWA